MNKYLMDHLFNNGTAHEIQYLYNLGDFLQSHNRAFSFMKVHWCESQKCKGIHKIDLDRPFNYSYIQKVLQSSWIVRN